MSYSSYKLLIPLASFLVTLVIIFWLLRSHLSLKAIDIPNERSSHSRPVPRIGGLAILAGITGGWLFFTNDISIPIALGGIFLSLFSFLDDLFDLRAIYRFGIQICVTGISLALIFSGQLNVFWLLLIIIATVWVTNLYNFMDGSDGLAAGMAIFGFGFYGIASLYMGDHNFALINFCVSAAATAFLYFNFYPAKIFMGDSGSILLGYLAASLGLLGWQENLWPLWFPITVFSPFILDASMTLLRRLKNGSKIWQAHREHYYQRLLHAGIGHKKTAIIEYCLMAAVGLTSLLATRLDNYGQKIFVIVWISIYGTLFFRLEVFCKNTASRNRNTSP